jgi:hypothetical protein
MYCFSVHDGPDGVVYVRKGCAFVVSAQGRIVIGSWSCCTVCHIRALDIFASLAASIIGDYIDEYMLLDL